MRFLTTAVLLLKKSILNGSLLTEIVVMLVLSFVLSNINIPDYSNAKIAFCTENSKIASEILKILQTRFENMNFSETSEEGMLAGIKNGSYDCGFKLEDDFDAKSTTHQKQIKCFTSPLSVKVAVAKECVGAAYMQYISPNILDSSAKEYFADYPENVQKALISRNNELSAGKSVFKIVFTEEVTKEIQESKNNITIHLTVALILFLVCFAAKNDIIQSKKQGPLQVFTGKTTVLYKLSTYLSALIFPLFFGFLIIMHYEGTNYLYECSRLFLFLIYSVLWLEGISFITKKHFRSMLLPIICVSILLISSNLIFGDLPWSESTSFLTPLSFYYKILM